MHGGMNFDLVHANDQHSQLTYFSIFTGSKESQNALLDSKYEFHFDQNNISILLFSTNMSSGVQL